MGDNSPLYRTTEKKDMKRWKNSLKTEPNNDETLPLSMLISQIAERDKNGKGVIKKKFSQKELFKIFFDNLYNLTGDKKRTEQKFQYKERAMSPERQNITVASDRNSFINDSNHEDDATSFDRVFCKDLSYVKLPKKISNWSKSLCTITECSMESNDSTVESYNSFKNDTFETSIMNPTSSFESINKSYHRTKEDTIKFNTTFHFDPKMKINDSSVGFNDSYDEQRYFNTMDTYDESFTSASRYPINFDNSYKRKKLLSYSPCKQDSFNIFNTTNPKIFETSQFNTSKNETPFYFSHQNDIDNPFEMKNYRQEISFKIWDNSSSEIYKEFDECVSKKPRLFK